MFPDPLSGPDLVRLTREGRTPAQIIEELKRTNTVLPLQASDILLLNEAGVSPEVLNYLQQALIDEVRWRERISQPYGFGTGFYRGFGPCPWPGGANRGYRGGWRC